MKAKKTILLGLAISLYSCTNEESSIKPAPKVTQISVSDSLQVRVNDDKDKIEPPIIPPIGSGPK